MRIVGSYRLVMIVLSVTLTQLCHGAFTGYWENYDCKGGDSRSFLFTHPAQLNQIVRRSGWHRFVDSHPDRCASVAQASMVYHSSDMVKNDARKFFWDCKNELLITGDNAPNVAQRDVRAEWLGINDPFFSGVLKISPENRQVGSIIDVNIFVGQYIDSPIFDDYWLTITLPVFSVINSLNPEAINVTGSVDYSPTDLLAAFNQPAWQFGKIVSERTTAGLGVIDFRFGRTYWASDGFEFSYYTGVSIPTARGQLAEYLFDAFVGNNGHFAFITGINMQMPLNVDIDCSYYCWFINLENVYLLRNSQTRTFDLREKPWSRYLMLNRKDGPGDQMIPAVNVLSQQVRVRPYDMVDFVTGIRLVNPRSEVEAGYGIWGHGDERIRINCDFPEIYGIAGRSVAQDAASCPQFPPTATSASRSTIACLADNDEEFVVIQRGDLDLKTPAAKKAIKHRFHAAFTYLHQSYSFAGFVTAGTYYEFPQSDNGALTAGGLWVKGGARF